MTDDFADSEKGSSLGIAESRTHSRAPMRSLAYIELSDDNGGLILNISEDGLAVQAVQVVSPEQLSQMKFRLPKTSIPIEVMGRLVWQLRSKKEAGIQFVNLSEEARQGIRDWIGTESARPAAETELSRQRPRQAEKLAPVAEAIKPSTVPVDAPKAHAATTEARKPPVPDPAPKAQPPTVETIKQQPGKTPAAPTKPAAAPSAPVPPKAKPKEPRPPIPEPTIASPRIPMPPSPAPPVIAAQSSAANVAVEQAAVFTSKGIPVAPANAPPVKPPSSGSAFPAGRLPFPSGARADGPKGQSPLPGTVPNMPSWHGYVAPGVGMRYRKPRGWWTYTAALGIIAAVGFAGLMMIDPSTISRARLATAEHQAATPSDVPQAVATNNANSSAVPSNNPASSIPPVNAANGAGAANPSTQPLRQTPPSTRAGNTSPRQINPSGGSTSPANQPTIPVSPGAAGSARPSATESHADRNAAPRTETPSRENERTARDETARGSATSNTPRNEAAQAAKEPPASQTQTPLGSSSSGNSSKNPAANAQPQLTSPATSSSAPTSTAATPQQPSATQRDQDDYARTARREVAAGAGNTNRAPTQETAAPRTTTPAENTRPSVEVSGEHSSPVTPSVPLIGVPSGSVGANSQFHAIRIPPELQSKAAQLAGNLQIGQMLSSYAPAYPVEAARAGVEGIVRLDVMIAPNGNVESVKILSGPPALTAVSVSAVKGWHYGETLLGGQPIEAEQYVTLVFRLAK